MQQNPLILDGKKLASQIKQELQNQIVNWERKPHFAIIQVGDLFASNKYIQNKMKIATEIGIKNTLFKFSADISEAELIFQVKKIAHKVDSLIVQLPLPNHINSQNILDSVPYNKDADGLSSLNSELFYNNSPQAIIPATPKGILLLLKYYKIPLAGYRTYVIGESKLVGKPIKELLSRQGGITRSFNILTGIAGSEEADVLVVAAGVSHLVQLHHLKKGAVVVDVGINSLGNNKITGDVDFLNVVHHVKAISPVPGGVGPMTVIALMSNIVEISQKMRNK